MQPRPLTFLEKVFVKVGSAYSKKMYGDATPSFIAELIRTLGIKGFFEWGKQTDEVKAIMAAEWGSWFEGEMLLGFGAMWNGCTYCSRTHVAAGNVYFHKEKGKLFPISEDEILDLQLLQDDEVIGVLKDRLQDPEHERILRLLLRQVELKRMTVQPDGREDQLIQMATNAWDWATECSIVVNRDPVPPISPIGKDRAAVDAYRAARGGPQPKAGTYADAGVTRA